MERRRRRSRGVTSTAAPPSPPPTAATGLDFDALYRAARDDVFAYVATLLRDGATAEDVTAAAFERAFRRRRGFDARRGTPRAWLFGIARNAALDELRRRRRSAPLAGEPVDPATSTLEDEAELAVRRASVRAALGRLDARDREVVALKFHAGLRGTEIAAVLGVSESNAGTRLHRALEKLRKEMSDDAR